MIQRIWPSTWRAAGTLARPVDTSNHGRVFSLSTRIILPYFSNMLKLFNKTINLRLMGFNCLKNEVMKLFLKLFFWIFHPSYVWYTYNFIFIYNRCVLWYSLACRKFFQEMSPLNDPILVTNRKTFIYNFNIF